MSESQNALNSASQKDDEISLIDLLSVLLHYKKMIIITTASVIPQRHPDCALIHAIYI